MSMEIISAHDVAFFVGIVYISFIQVLGLVKTYSFDELPLKN